MKHSSISDESLVSGGKISQPNPRDPYLTLSGFERLPLIRQAAGAECGLACLAMIASFHGYRTDITELRRKFPVSLRGADLKTISDVANEVGLSTRSLRLEVHEMNQLRTPCVLHWEFDHFVVLKKVKKNRIIIHDPAHGVRVIRMDEVGQAFTGIALEVTPTESFRKKQKPKGLTLGNFVRFDRSFISSFSLGLILSVLVELFILSAPFYMQITVDEVLIKGDKNLLDALAVGFGLIILFQVISSTLRGLNFQYLGHVLSFDMSSRVFHRMMKLPVNFFTNRQLGDVQHRVQSLEQVKQFLISSAPSVIMDGIFGIVVLAILFAYHFNLTLIVLGAVILYVAWKLAMFGLMKRAAGDLIVAEADSQTHLLETLRSMPTIKMMSIEQKRENRWLNTNARRLNAGIRVGNLGLANGAFNQILFQGLRVIVIFAAANMALDGELTIGMITAFIAYYGIFTQRVTGLVDQFIAMRLLQVPLGRLADIIFERPEVSGSDGGRNKLLEGSVEVRNVYFKYGRAERNVLLGACLNVRPGEFLAIVGPSGAGKTTLLKILAGIECPDNGSVLFDGRPIETWNKNTLREQIGIVLQEDTLFRGSIAENISLFDDQIDMGLVREVSRQAGIEIEIEAMPMGYESQIGDMGSTLSGGQKQRVFLARALYRKPRILFLDEATSHLDIENEKRVLSELTNLGITRIIIAHRPETIAAADRVVIMADGRLAEVPNGQQQVAPESLCQAD
ncbi:peptidase domain-containing ABC transporter [Paremcibacter congregatus]|uniref:peptidase domain-containing ABC transporter n=1 Tax=Paremcibacter congregatus TaxID=2043170 RepID=UPI003A94695D